MFCFSVLVDARHLGVVHTGGNRAVMELNLFSLHPFSTFPVSAPVPHLFLPFCSRSFLLCILISIVSFVIESCLYVLLCCFLVHFIVHSFRHSFVLSFFHSLFRTFFRPSCLLLFLPSVCVHGSFPKGRRTRPRPRKPSPVGPAGRGTCEPHVEQLHCRPTCFLRLNRTAPLFFGIGCGTKSKPHEPQSKPR